MTTCPHYKLDPEFCPICQRCRAQHAEAERDRYKAALQRIADLSEPWKGEEWAPGVLGDLARQALHDTQTP